jgi:hypothetical protein
MTSIVSSWVDKEDWKFFRCGRRHILFEPVGKVCLTDIIDRLIVS